MASSPAEATARIGALNAALRPVWRGDVLERGQARAAKEPEVRVRLRAGALTLDLVGLRGGAEG